MSARPRNVQERQDQRLREMWGMMTCKAIAKKLGYSNESNVSHRAKHLGLPSLKSPEYREGKRDILAAQKANRERQALHRKKLRAGRVRGDEAEMEKVEPIDRPVCMVCHGRSATWDGHPQCRGVGRRAA